tara:strand:+ start:213 stop:1922 length:1710 start_codon:yes stop_codon:yes gene_type:complete
MSDGDLASAEDFFNLLFPDGVGDDAKLTTLLLDPETRMANRDTLELFNKMVNLSVQKTEVGKVLAGRIMKLFTVQQTTLSVLNWAMEKEVKTLENSVDASLAQYLGLGPYVLEQFYSSSSVKAYLEKVVVTPLRRIMQKSLSPRNDEVSEEALYDMCEKVLDTILAEVENTPVALRQVLLHARSKASEKMAPHIAGLIFFQQVICPAIRDPVGWGLVDDVKAVELHHCATVSKIVNGFGGNHSVVSGGTMLSSKVNMFIHSHKKVVDEVMGKLIDEESILSAIKRTAVRFEVQMKLDMQAVEDFLAFLRCFFLSNTIAIISAGTEGLVKKSLSLDDENSMRVRVRSCSSAAMLRQRFSVRTTSDRALQCTVEEEDEDVASTSSQSPSTQRVRIARSGSPPLRKASPPPRRKNDDKAEKEEEAPETNRAKVPQEPVVEYKFFFAQKIKPLKDIWPTRLPPPQKWPEGTNVPTAKNIVFGKCLEQLVFEYGSAETIVSPESEFEIEHLERMTTRFFQDHMMTDKHYNYIGMEEGIGPIVCSVEAPSRAMGDQVKVHLLLQSFSVSYSDFAL